MFVPQLAQLVEEYAEEKGRLHPSVVEGKVNLKDYDILAKYFKEREAREQRVQRAKPKGPETGKLVLQFQQAIDKEEEEKERVKKGPEARKPKGK